MRLYSGISILLGLLLVNGCDGAHQEVARTIGPATIVMEPAESLDPAERPPVEFQHDKHVKELQKEGCKECHLIDDKQKQSPRLKQVIDLSNRDAFAKSFHDACLGCHQKRLADGKKTGPEDCGECHVQRPPATTTRLAMQLDYSLHYRHLKSQKEKCENCHHVYNEKLKKLEYKKGEESSCRDCHIDVDQDKNLSWRNAAHTDCITCHLRNEEQRKSPEEKNGPTACVGCHEEESRKKIEKLEKVPRLKRNQPDRTWILTPDAKFNRVGFDHKIHEPLTFSCSTCHHKTLKPCRECHTLVGEKKGAWIPLEKSQHRFDSEIACVGCHHIQTFKPECIGCHSQTGVPPGPRSCEVCHQGPVPEKGPKDAKELPPGELFSEVKLAALPQVSKEDFPEKLTLDIKGKKYEPTQFPHLKIVKKLDEQSRKDKLANRFHQEINATCAACHHQSPIGKRPPPCKSCHGEAAHPTKDLPGLTNAYHRQCIGCHQAMGHKAQGCTDCHKEVPK